MTEDCCQSWACPCWLMMLPLMLNWKSQKQSYQTTTLVLSIEATSKYTLNLFIKKLSNSRAMLQVYYKLYVLSEVSNRTWIFTFMKLSYRVLNLKQENSKSQHLKENSNHFSLIHHFPSNQNKYLFLSTQKTQILNNSIRWARGMIKPYKIFY